MTTTVPRSITTTGSTTSSTKPSLRPLVRAGVQHGFAGAALTLAVAGAAKAVGVSFEASGEAIPLLGFPQMTLLFTAVGVAIAAVIARRAATPQRTFLAVTLVLTVLSFASPFTVSADAATRVAIELTHIAAAAVVIPGLARRLPLVRR